MSTKNTNEQDAADALDDNDMDLTAEMFRSGDTAEETLVQMERLKYGVVYHNARFSDLDGLAIYEGDIALGSTEDVRDKDDPSTRGVGITGLHFRWEKGVVPYVTEDALRPLVTAAINHWQQKTPFRFVQRTSQTDYLSFKRLNGCWSYVGKRGGEQEISLGSGCGLGSAIHEIGHALGLWHEQSRSDRDKFIEVVWANISPQHRHNFDTHVLDGDDLGNYDYTSIMHYPATAFSTNGQPTIKVRQSGQPIGQRSGLSKGDIGAIRMMYPNLKWS